MLLMSTSSATLSVMTGTNTRGQPYHHGDLRNALLQAATELLREQGVAGLSLRAAARRAGVSHAGPYRHFRNKAALLRALAMVGFEALADAVNAAAARYPDDPARQLVEAGVAYVGLALDNPERTRLMFGGELGHAGDDDLARAAHGAFEALVAIIRNGIESGAYAGGDAGRLAVSAWAKVHGIAVLLIAGQIQVASSRQETIGLVREVCRVELFGLMKTGEPRPGAP